MDMDYCATVLSKGSSTADRPDGHDHVCFARFDVRDARRGSARSSFHESCSNDYLLNLDINASCSQDLYAADTFDRRHTCSQPTP